MKDKKEKGISQGRGLWESDLRLWNVNEIRIEEKIHASEVKGRKSLVKKIFVMVKDQLEK